MKIKFTGNEEQVKTAEKCLSVYLGDYPPEKQYAAAIMLHMILKDEGYAKLMEYVKEITGFRVNNRNSSRVIAWKKRIKKIGKCEICGATSGLVAHHKIPWSGSISGRTDLNNGQCLCKSCHKMMHNDAQWIDYMMQRG